MNFQEANIHLQDHKKICRLSWRANAKIVRCMEKIHLHSDHGMVEWRPNSDDFVANDWELWHDKIEYNPKPKEWEEDLNGLTDFDLFEAPPWEDL